MSCDILVRHAAKAAQHKYITNVGRQIENGALQFQSAFLLRQLRHVDLHLLCDGNETEVGRADGVAPVAITE